MSASPEHWCRIPELENLTDLMTLEERKALSLPYVEKSDGKVKKYEKCKMYDVNYTAIVESWLGNASREEGEDEARSTRTRLPPPPVGNPDWPVTKCRHGWIYDNRDYDSTLVTEVNWSTFSLFPLFFFFFFEIEIEREHERQRRWSRTAVVYIIPLNAVNRSLGVEFRSNFAECRVSRDDSPWPLPSRIILLPMDSLELNSAARSVPFVEHRACTAFLLVSSRSRFPTSSFRSPHVIPFPTKPPQGERNRFAKSEFPEFIFRPNITYSIMDRRFEASGSPRETVNPTATSTPIPFLSSRRRKEREREGGRGEGEGERARHAARERSINALLNCRN